jgi:hypothetical protein
MGIAVYLQLNLHFAEINLDLKNAHTFSSRDKAEEELESDVIFYYPLEVFMTLYGKTMTPKGTTRVELTAHSQVSTCR